MRSLRFRHQVIAMVVFGSALLAAPAVNASAGFRVTLDGQPSTVAEASQFHCHDVLPTEFQCFRLRAARDRAVEKVVVPKRAGSTGVDPLSASSTGYVVAYAAISYAGSSVVLSQNYSNLGTIGWDNIISSYKVFTGATGAFYEYTNYAGRYQEYCCFTNVWYVGDALNDRFSSFLLP